MKSYDAAATINAPPQRIWDILTDGPAYASWEYTGPLLGMIWRTIPDLGPSFAKFADGLKRHAEAGVTATAAHAAPAATAEGDR